ncbi:MAG: DUF192 domain-containing protein [Oligoflexia bacterium]|nr:DUF192 domain-containing protein [Oligoflexia bacterium]
MNLYIDEKLISSNVKNARSFTERFNGLMFRKHLDSDEGLFFANCNWIHTMFMNFSIDVLYLDKKYKIIDVDNAVKPWRFCSPRLKARHVVEMRAGFINDNSVSIGGVVRCTG